MNSNRELPFHSFSPPSPPAGHPTFEHYSSSIGVSVTHEVSIIFSKRRHCCHHAPVVGLPCVSAHVKQKHLETQKSHRHTTVTIKGFIQTQFMCFLIHKSPKRKHVPVVSLTYWILPLVIHWALHCSKQTRGGSVLLSAAPGLRELHSAQTEYFWSVNKSFCLCVYCVYHRHVLITTTDLYMTLWNLKKQQIQTKKKVLCFTFNDFLPKLKI